MATLPQLIEEDIREIDAALRDLLYKSEASSALVIDKGGFLITKAGQGQDYDEMTLAALSAASFAATQGLASLVSETNFYSVYQQGENFSVLVHNIDEHCLLTVIFKASIGVGSVKYYTNDTIKEVARQLKVARDREPDQGLDLSMANLADASVLFKKKVA